MTFDHPALAFGALLGLLPPLLHLFARRKARVRAFAAIDFLLRARRGGERRVRLVRLLLMLARMAILAAIPLALARPHRANAAHLQEVAAGPKATALVLDGSGSMMYRRGDKSLFALARKEARRRLAELGADEPATALLCAARHAVPPPPTDDRATLIGVIDGFEATEEPADLATCIEEAAQALASSDVPGKRIVVITDLQQTSWDLGRPAPTVSTPRGVVRPEFEVIDVAEGPLPNQSLSDLSVVASAAVGEHGYQFSFTVHNFSSRPVQNLPVALETGGRTIARGFCDLQPFGSQRKVLAATFPAGTVVEGRIALPPDALAADDAIPFVLPVPRQARALLVDGAPSNLRYLDEAFFVQTALAAAGGAIEARTVDPETLTAQDLDPARVDVVMLLDVHSLERGVVAALKQFVEKGGGLFVSLGDQIDPEALDGALGALLPAQLRLVKTAAPPPHAGGAEETVTAPAPAHLARVDFTSPLFAGFGGASDGLLGTRVYRYMLVEPPPKEVQVLAWYDDGAPAFILGQRRAGRVLLFTSSVAREWTDWPIRTSFVPVMQQAVLLLAKVGDAPIPPVELVGSRHLFRAGEPIPVSAKLPSGKELRVQVTPAGERSLAALPEAGLLQLRWADAEGHRVEKGDGDIPVAFDPRESDTRRLDPAEVTARYGGVVRSDVIPPLGAGQVTLWTELMVLAVLFFGAEAILGA